MTGAEDKPLLILDRVGEGRVALLTSDQVWLWGRGFEGGGPQLELLRRIAHWSMKEPELEEEALLADVRDGLAVRFTAARCRTAPDRCRSPPPTAASARSRWPPTGRAGSSRTGPRPTRPVPPCGWRHAPRAGAWPRGAPRIRGDGGRRALLTPLVEASGGSVRVCPTACWTCARRVRAGRPAAMAWAAPGSASPRAMPRPSTGLDRKPLLPGWAWLALIAGLILTAGWPRGGAVPPDPLAIRPPGW